MTVKLQKNGTVTVQKRSVKQNWYEQIVQYLRNVNLVKLSFASMVWNWNHKITSKTRLAKWTRGQTWFLWQNSSAPPSYTSSSTWCLLGDYWFIDWFLKGRRLQRVVENHLKSSGYNLIWTVKSDYWHFVWSLYSCTGDKGAKQNNGNPIPVQCHRTGPVMDSLLPTWSAITPVQSSSQRHSMTKQR